MKKIRVPAVAGIFYPADPDQLHTLLAQMIGEAPNSLKVPKAMIAPHAGYIYSGAIAATAYARLQTAKQKIKQVVLIGPSHRLGFKGLALSTAEQFSTPLGSIDVDMDKVKQLLTYSYININDQAHKDEHSLEVHLPFLQTVLDSFTLVPIVTGNVSAEDIAELINFFWKDSETLIVISSDLSHFLDYESAVQLDKKTSKHIELLQYEKLDSHAACGYIPVRGLLAFAKKMSLKIKTLDVRNSGDTAGSGDKSRVVGYGAYVIE